MPDSQWIADIDAASFATAVLERSRTVPVVLDFWATWCGPCQTLGPALEALAVEGDGRFVLAKIDIDRNPEITQAFRIESVPTVIAVVDGRPVDGFQGAQPEQELRAFLDRVAPVTEARVSPVLERVARLEQAGDAAAATDLLREHLRAEPGDGEARIRLAELLLGEGRLADARLAIDELGEEQAATPAVRALRTRLAFAESAGDIEALRAAAAEHPEDARAHLELGTALVAGEDWADGLEELLEAIRRDPEGAGAEAKQKMLEVFDLLGLEHPTANEYRFKLSLELFA